MVMNPLKNVILSATIAITAAVVATVSGNLDACGNLGTKNTASLVYTDVRDCFMSIPFDRDIASTTMGSIYVLFKDYYIFRDSALTPNLGSPFSSPPVDIMGEIETIRSTKYTSDYTFQNDIKNALSKLNDAHVSYNVDCYHAYYFLQPVTLYAPVVDGKQVVHIYSDFLQRGYEDCEVLAIDGKSPLSQIQEYSDTTGISKDPGARQNYVTAHEIFDETTGRYTLSPGSFSQRRTMPKSGYIDYELKCKNSNSPIKLREPWKVVPSGALPVFNSTESFVTNLCKPEPADSTNSNKKVAVARTKKHVIPAHEKSVFPGEYSKKAKEPIANSDMLGFGNSTAVYHLKSQPDVGVLAVFTHNINDMESELKFISEKLNELHTRNVSKILIDFQSNTGGLISYASTLVQLFFPNKGLMDKILANDLRTGPSIKEVSKKSFGVSDGFYDSTGFLDLKTGKPFTDSSLFLDEITRDRNGVSAEYSQLTSFITPVLPIDKKILSYPWTNNPANIRLLSDATCGSSCALSSYFFHSLNKVQAYSIGGIKDQELSIYSFAGGAVGSLSQINEEYALGKLESPMSDLPYISDLSLPLVEVYARDSEIPLEYDYKEYPADFHINFDPINARNREVMWGQVAGDAWK